MVTDIVFDLDGTLIDSIPAVAAAINRLLEEMALPVLSTADVTTMVGEGARATLERAITAAGGEIGDRVEALERRYLEHYLENPAANTVIYPDVLAVLQRFRDQGIRMGVCTNKPGATTRPVLDALGLASFFDAVSTADDTRFRKPDGRHVLETLAAMGAASSGAVMVGDSETDVAAARNAGIPVVAVDYGYCHVPVADLQANVLISRFADLPDALDRIAKGL